MSDTYRGLADEDLRPHSRLREAVGDIVDLEFGAPGTEEDLIAALDGIDVVFATSRLPLSRRVLEATELSIVAKVGTGIDNVDLVAADDLGIAATYTPGANALAVAEHTVGLLLSVCHRITAGDDLLRAGGWRDDFTPGIQLSGKPIGIVGYGDVGSRVAQLLTGFGGEILAHDPYIEPMDAELGGASLVGFEELLERSHAVTVNAELTGETRGMFDAAAFDRMRDGAILVNTARGPIVEEAALIDALSSGKLRGAGLDVFEEEPPVTSPLLGRDDVVVTPHVAAATEESRARTLELIARNVRALLGGESIDDRFVAKPDEKWNRY